MKIKPTTNNEHRTSNFERVRGGWNAAFDVGRSMLDVRCFRSPRHPSPVTRPAERGVALILTLILLSVTLVMALAFLAISGRDRGSVATQSDTATTRLAADAGLAAAEAQIAANVLSSTNPYNFGLLVSTNYINAYGFQAGVANPTNVNFDYLSGGGALNQNDLLQALENLYYLPRAPVWLSNTVTHAMENRFYLDLNRNGRDDPNGVVPNVELVNGLVVTNGTTFQVGDPEWIGVLEHPDQPYGPQNPFVARYAFIALPVGNSLDLNAIYNQAFDTITGNRIVNPPPVGDVYLRNQGVGSWELNLAAFLADLNTNQWAQPVAGAFPNSTYYYYQFLSRENEGVAFDDARSLLAFRYANNYPSLMPVGGNAPPGLFTTAGIFPPFQNNIDGYSDGPLMTSPAGVNVGGQNVALPWAGADNFNHFYNLPADLFDPTRTQMGVTAAQITSGDYFSNHLAAASAGASTYDRYTFYRMLGQLGTDTTPDSGKMDLNYDNLDPVNGTVSATNFMAWTPLGFFTNAADRMLKAYTAQWAVSYYTNTDGAFVATNNPNFVATFNVTNYFGLTPTPGVPGIPVLVSNQFVYTPAVNRLLQLAANIYDATTNNLGVNGNRYDYPSVFRPLFSRDANRLGVAGMGTNLFITGYTNVTSFAGQFDPQINLPVDPSFLAQTNVQVLNLPVNVYGVPWIIGAKKGFPNFNELAMDTAFQITRKVEVTRPSTTSLANTYSYHQMFILNLTNQVGVECWNSYTNAYTNGVMIYVYDNLENIALTNDEGYSTNLNIPLANAEPVAVWPGTQTPYSFQIPLYAAVMSLTNSIYRFNQVAPNLFAPALTPDLGETYETSVTGYPQPHWWLTVNNDLRVFMVDTNANQVIDYVELSGPNSSLDLSSKIMTIYDTDTGANDLWATNWNNNLNIPQGLASQIQVSLGLYPPNAPNALDVANGGPWPATTGGNVQQQDDEVDAFRAFFHAGPIYNNIGSQEAIAAADMTNNMQVPFTPTATVVQHISWQANDPLVHYLANDLNWAGAVRIDTLVTSLGNSSDGDNLGILNARYAPWGKTMSAGTDQVDGNTENLAYKDPLVWSSDNWDFPSYKLPTVGWLGRVHRGTPWQTVYLKSTNILAWVQGNNAPGPLTWRDWTGNYNGFDAANAGPVQDWLLFDLFTTAFNDNATRGTLSVNQSADRYDPVANPAAGLAAWSALFSGVVAPNPTNFNFYTFINPAGPAGVNSALGELVTNINYTRSTFTNADGLVGAFEHEGDILATPQLTVQSPFLNPALAGYNNDEMYEWLPQQVMSLLRDSSSPRYVIYSYGQALKPAPNGVYLGAGSYFGMVTNYQVVAETAARAVVRLDTVRTNANGVITVTPPHAVIEQFNILPPN